jgi:hypothetical protein
VLTSAEELGKVLAKGCSEIRVSTSSRSGWAETTYRTLDHQFGWSVYSPSSVSSTCSVEDSFLEALSSHCTSRLSFFRKDIGKIGESWREAGDGGDAKEANRVEEHFIATSKHITNQPDGA